MASSVTETIAVGNIPQVGTPGEGEYTYTLAWTSDASAGTVSFVGTKQITGFVFRVVISPGAGGVQPSNGYAATLKTDDFTGIDILNGAASSLSNTTQTEVLPTVAATDGTNTATIPRMLANVLTLAMSGCGNSKQGQIRVYLKR